MSTTTDAVPHPVSPARLTHSKPLRRRLTIALSVALLAALLVLPELGARLLSRLASPSSKLAYDTITEGYPLRDQLLRDLKHAVQFEYREYYLFSPRPASSQTINFTNYFGARATPASAPPAEARERIWAFGGSTMQNLEVDDALTLANQIVVALNGRGTPALLHNFGVAAFHSSLETIKFQELLRRVPAHERPTTVIFYDGFNDSRGAYAHGANRLQQDISSKLRDLIERRHPRLIVYSASEMLARYSVLWRDYGRPGLEARLHGIDPPDASEANLSAAVETYTTNVRLTRAVCEAFGLRCLFVLQPLIITRSPLTPIETATLQALGAESVAFGRAFYERAVRALGGQPGFHDFSHVVDGIPEPVFFDYGHTSPAAGIVIGQALADRIARGAARPRP
jgi:hypothetical protein